MDSRFVLGERYVPGPRVLKKSQKVTVGIFSYIKNGEKKCIFFIDFESSEDVRHRVSDTRARMMCQAAVIGSGIPWVAVEHLGGTQTPPDYF